ncbi:unnamed protein product, partial [Mesorhabditis belari]|uniref:Uncharacterized protein n=1 Tax=Mesorhabditis belari TaxID=2138241 RepID=A0AAF3EH81_9BILA
MCSILMVSSLFLTIVVAEELVWTSLKVPSGEDMRTCQPRDGERTYRCPPNNSVDSLNEKLTCIKKSQFCDKNPDCPNESDEDLTKCMFLELTVNQIHFVREAIYKLMQELHEKRESEKTSRLRNSKFSDVRLRK